MTTSGCFTSFRINAVLWGLSHPQFRLQCFIFARVLGILGCFTGTFGGTLGSRSQEELFRFLMQDYLNLFWPFPIFERLIQTVLMVGKVSCGAFEVASFGSKSWRGFWGYDNLTHIEHLQPIASISVVVTRVWCGQMKIKDYKIHIIWTKHNAAPTCFNVTAHAYFKHKACQKRLLLWIK